MRWRLALLTALVVVAAGCIGGTEAPAAETDGDTPSAPETTAPDVEEGAPELDADALDTTPRDLTLWFGPSHRLVEQVPAAGSEPEVLDAAMFYTMQAGQTAQWSTWLTDPVPVAYEVVGDVTVRLRIVADQAAHETTPRAAGFPSSGGWIGTGTARNLFYLQADSPATLEAGKEVAFEKRVTIPEGGLLVLPGESFSPHTWTAFKTADGSPVRYVLGGDDGSRVTMRVRNVTLPATMAAVPLLDEAGEMGPHPGFTTAGNPDAKEFALELPPGTAYVVVESTGKARSGHCDVDVDVLRGSTVVLGGHGPTTQERVVLGPGMIAANGLSYTVHVSSASNSGCTWGLKATAMVAS